MIRSSPDDARKAKEELARLQASPPASWRRRGARRRTSSEHALRCRPVRRRHEAEGPRRRRRFVRNAQREIDTQTHRAIETIRREAVDLSVAVASKILRRDITKADNERLVDDAIRRCRRKRGTEIDGLLLLMTLI